MCVGGWRGFYWSTWSKHHLQQVYLWRLCLPCRTLFSNTGVWEKELANKKYEEIERHWMPIIKKYDKLQSETVDCSKKKYYVLSMFPYPSGKLHMGHVRVYTLSDTMARFYRLAGYTVIHPMGWDAFGLPAENAAIEREEKPDQWTYKNIANMKQQLDQLGCSFDWHRECTTCDPSYYKWTQYLFLKMFDAGLVYQREGEVNWDPVDMTVLADEQIDETGRSWRSGAKVEKRFLKQWYIKTTAMSQSLYEGLSEVDQSLWRDIVQLQRHWIGECDGTRLQFSVKSSEDGRQYDPLNIYTSTPEAVYGVAFIAISPQHRLNQQQLYQDKNLAQDKDILLSLNAIHPFSGESIPILVSSSTEFDEFNDVQLGIPSVDEAAQRVAERLGLTYSHVLEGMKGEEKLVCSQDMNGLTRSEAFKAVLQKAKALGVGGDVLSRRLRDWLISRQRYWGTPIPMIHCDTCQVVPVPYKDLPVELPTIHKLTGHGPSPLTVQHDWINTTCPKCNGPAKRETDTMDTFVDSSWYFLRYLDPHNTTEPFSKGSADEFMPVDLYIGGKEHAVMHLYYARFFCHFLYEQGMLPQREPFVSLLTQGMVMGQTYQVKDSGRYLAPDQVDFTGSELREKSTGSAVVTHWEKMSKSKHNGADPQDVVDEFGVDATRLCILFNVSPQSNRKWSNEAFKGILRWQSRMWKLVGNLINIETTGQPGNYDAGTLAAWDEQVYKERNLAVKEVTFHCSVSFLLNTAVAFLQRFTSTLGKVPPSAARQSFQYKRSLADLCIMLAPMAPCFASELWAGLASACPADTRLPFLWDKSILDQSWPVIDADYQLPLFLKINNGDRFSIGIRRDILDTLTCDLAHDLVRPDPRYQQYCQGRQFQKIDFSLQPGYQATINFVPERQVSQ